MRYQLLVRFDSRYANQLAEKTGRPEGERAVPNRNAVEEKIRTSTATIRA